MFARALSLVVAGFFILQSHVRADIYVVTTTSEKGPGSLGQAILDANTHSNSSASNPDRIHFAIPGSGVQTILPTLPLPDITDPVVIDGFSQNGAHPNSNPVGQGLNPSLMIELDGGHLGVEGNGLTITCGNSTVRGLIINRFLSGVMCRGESGNIIEGNYIGTDRTGTFAPRNINLGREAQQSFGVTLEDCATSRVGGQQPSSRNLMSGGYYADVYITGPGATGNVIEGNLIGTKASGLTALELGSGSGVLLVDGASSNLIGGTVIEARNVVSSSDSDGANHVGVYFYPADIGFASTFSNLVQGNFMGLNVTGSGVTDSDDDPSGFGVFITGHDNQIGGTEPGAGNVISGNRVGGIRVGGASDGYEATDNVIQGNFVGTDESGTLPLGNGGDGIALGGLANRNMIGGPQAGAGNRIAFTYAGAGITALNFPVSGTGNAILGNSIYGNSALGIDLENDFVTPNDSGDADAGPNNLQNYPVLTSANFADSSVLIRGTLDSVASRSYRIEFFGDGVVDASGFGEGKVFLGGGLVGTGADGMAAFELGWPCPVGTRAVSATATDPDGNTSEFSQTIQITGIPAPQLLNISTRLGVQTGDNALIGGFIITGIDAKRVLIRAIGPSLSATVPGALANTTLNLFQNATILASNDNWRDTQESEIQATGIPPSDDLESAIVRTLYPGAYTAVMRGRDDATGIGVVEVYDIDQGVISQLSNISTRGVVQTAENVMIGGLIFLPAGGGSGTVVVRGIGPSLRNFGISGELHDPTLELLNSEGAVIRSNNDWRQTQEAELIAAGLQPVDDRESALIQVVSPGSYTAIVRGRGDTTGVALVEVYHLE